VIAKPQLRGAEGGKLSLKIGDQIPIISTSYTPIATGGAGVNPLSSYQYQDVGVNLDITPRVTLEGDILMDLTVEDTSRKADVVIAGVNIPSFGQRTVTTRLRLRDGESNLLAGLLQENSSDSIKGFPGAIHVPVLKQLFSGNNKTVDQTDIVMLLTPHIIRTPGITQADLQPVSIGTQTNLALGGPPPIITVEPELPAPAPAALAPATPGATSLRPPGAAPGAPPPGQTPQPPTGPPVAPPPDATPVPGTVVGPAPPPTPTPTAAAAPTPTQPAAPAPVPPTTATGFGLAQIVLSPPPTFRVGGGPYTVPVSVTNASRLSTIALTITFDAALLRPRVVQEGSFMRSGGVSATFAQQVSPGRIDITIARAGDATGATGTGLLAAVLFDALAPGAATLTVSGTATGPGGTPMGLQFTPVRVTIQP
jgi:general secretion pathway protein D